MNNTSQNLLSEGPSYVDFPFNIDWNGRAATTTRADHIRDLIEQVLFTAPGERVNRLTLGSGVERLLFSPNSTLLAETTRVTAEAALLQWLGHLIELVSLTIESRESTLIIEVEYRLQNERESQTARFERAL